MLATALSYLVLTGYDFSALKYAGAQVRRSTVRVGPSSSRTARSRSRRRARWSQESIRALFAELERHTAECIFPDGDLENLSHFLQAYYRLPSYEPAVLVGQGADATPLRRRWPKEGSQS